MSRPTDPSSPSVSDSPKKYEPTPAERGALDRTTKRAQKEAPSPKFRLTPKNGQVSILPDHTDDMTGASLILDAMGTANAQLAEGLLLQLALAAKQGEQVTQREINTIVATMHAIGPRDATEGLLAAQMAAVHDATMVAAKRLKQCETIDQQNSASSMFNKLARTFAAQMEALKRYRSNGEQRVTVNHQHVSVSAQQAVVGIKQGGGGDLERRDQSHALEQTSRSSSADARGAALLSQEQAVGMPMPSTCSQREEGGPNARS